MVNKDLHKVTPSVIIILKIDSHRELQFSNPEKGPKSEGKRPPVIIRLATGLERKAFL